MKGISFSKILQLGGFAAAAILIAFGIVSIVMSYNGRNTVHDNLRAEQITFGDAKDDPAIPAKYSGALVDTGAEARAFAKMMRVHALDAAGGLTYAEMGRFLAKPGTPKQFTDGNGGTSDPKYALIDEEGKPVSNAARNTWVTATALMSALNLAYTAEQISLFGLVVGIALLLSGIGFGILAAAGALRDARFPLIHRAAKATPATPVPTV